MKNHFDTAHCPTSGFVGANLKEALDYCDLSYSTSKPLSELMSISTAIIALNEWLGHISNYFGQKQMSVGLRMVSMFWYLINDLFV